ncbi:MAG: HAMP domain-containing histidine kinase [Lachnospiraceae bacterium]|nr:HAMP domain-containing histidine kinase [Lachnospiraceae bacterium]
MFWKTSKIMDRLDEMLESAIDGSFEEKNFSESRLSRLEAKMYHYLASGCTARKQLTAEKDAIKELVSDISHQTKTPLANIILYTQLLKEQGLDKESGALAAQIEQQAEKLNFLIQALIKTSRLENGIVAPVPRKTNVQELLDGLDCASQAADRQITCVIHDVNTAMTAFFDCKWTTEAVSNILDNAVKYTCPGGRVEVSAREYEMFVCIDVADTGIGIAEEETARIFQRFYRSPAVSEEKGVGIGLYLAREIVEKQDGYIRVVSELGKGSTFSVFLPKQQNVSKL